MASNGTVVALYTDEGLTNAVFPVTVVSAVTGAQPTLVSGTNIKTINGSSIVGSGNLTLASDKASVGLGNVDNTSDANKPVSTATQTALNAKQNTLVSGTNIKSINSKSIVGSGNLTLADLGIVSSGTTVPTSFSTWIFVNTSTKKVYIWDSSAYELMNSWQ